PTMPAVAMGKIQAFPWANRPSGLAGEVDVLGLDRPRGPARRRLVFQYRFVCAMTWSGGGAPHAVWSPVVWASLTRVASYPLANAPWSVERMHASVCAPTTTSRPTPRPDRTVSRVVSSKESP